MHFKSLFVLASLAVFSFAETSIAKVQDSISNKMTSAFIDFTTAVQAFPMSGGTLKQAKSIHYAANTFSNVIANSTNNMNDITSRLSRADSQTILDYLEAMEPGFFQSLKGIAIRKPAFEALPSGDVPALIKQDLTTMRTSAVSFMDSFIAHASTEVLGEARTMKSGVKSIFTAIMAIYNINILGV
ncbi:hypothetical protein J132_01466 [Termitomyces sp. J132]|nr:hypothetical protein H2248_001662 [Termitomyces sp. 'cryptogamus']KNZ72953.1 hypothetical protein J132_01466 [Termitomyces sp. J132]